ncbi:MAG: penicillin-binding protein [Lachnospiraceae bacterium]|nr:penicillin-binding protein [Lachnospiraceae bacterium]
MNYGSKGIRKQMRSVNSRVPKTKTKLALSVLKLFLVGLVSLGLVGACIGFGVFRGMLDNVPAIEDIDVSPSGFFTTIYDASGNEIQTLVMAGANREEVALEEIPDHVINAFIAIEDARFWTNNGIDMKGMLRAFVDGLREKEFGSGASTITQQLIKNNVFGGGMEASFGEKVERKIQEQYLAIELTKVMSKEKILENYLNTINLGNNSLGIQAASRRYFGKPVGELTLSEGAVIAATTSSPATYDPIREPEENAKRRAIILDYMVEQGYISVEERDEALADDVYERIAAHNATVIEEAKDDHYSYFVDSLIDQVLDDLVNDAGYSREQARTKLYSGGLKIYATQDPTIQAIVDEEINNPENYPILKYGLSYRYSLEHPDGTVDNYSEGHVKLHLQEQTGTSVKLIFNTEEEVYAAVQSFKESIKQEGDKELGEVLEVTLQPQVSFVLMDQNTGEVKAISNGRGEKTSSLSLRRATSSLRQPGSCFKVIAAFAPALDTGGNTLSTVYYDAPFSVSVKEFGNWWGDMYTGYSNIRQGIVYSMNIVATKCLMETVSPRLGYQYARDLGITSLVESETLADGTVLTDIGAALALGGLTYGVTNLELTGAYAAIANGGTYVEPILYTKVLDNTGRVILDNSKNQTRTTVLKDTTAYLLTSAMQSSCDSNQYFNLGIYSTGTKARLDTMSTAGKTGTTTDNNDLWFVGYTPYYTAGIWEGYDVNDYISENDSSTKTIWKKIMTRVHEGMSDPGFKIPVGMETATICAKCGKLAIAGVCEMDERPGMVVTEYYAPGTTPTEICDCHVKVTVCAESGELASVYCPDGLRQERVFMLLNPPSPDPTYDTEYALPEALRNGTCHIHTVLWAAAHGIGSPAVDRGAAIPNGLSDRLGQVVPSTSAAE